MYDEERGLEALIKKRNLHQMFGLGAVGVAGWLRHAEELGRVRMRYGVRYHGGYREVDAVDRMASFVPE